jgi:hypothetical protein
MEGRPNLPEESNFPFTRPHIFDALHAQLVGRFTDRFKAPKVFLGPLVFPLLQLQGFFQDKIESIEWLYHGIFRLVIRASYA